MLPECSECETFENTRGIKVIGIGKLLGFFFYIAQVFGGVSENPFAESGEANKAFDNNHDAAFLW